MEANKEIDIIYGSKKLKKQAGQWLAEQNIVKLMDLLGPKLEKKIHCTLDIGTETMKSQEGDKVDSTGEMAGSTDEFNQRAYRIKTLAQSEIDSSVSSLLKYEAEFCVKLYKINQLLSEYIKEQKIEGQFVKTEFKKDNSLNHEYVYKLFRNAFYDVDNRFALNKNMCKKLQLQSFLP
jgi:hypothetical protein